MFSSSTTSKFSHDVEKDCLDMCKFFVHAYNIVYTSTDLIERSVQMYYDCTKICCDEFSKKKMKKNEEK